MTQSQSGLDRWRERDQARNASARVTAAQAAMLPAVEAAVSAKSKPAVTPLSDRHRAILRTVEASLRSTGRVCVVLPAIECSCGVARFGDGVCFVCANPVVMVSTS